MSVPPGRRRFLRPPERPALVAHGAGNRREALEEALRDGADYVEVDLWLRNGRFEARHERRLHGIPLLFERWYLRLPPRRPIELPELFARTEGRVGVLFDLKNSGATMTDTLARALQTTDGPPPVVSSQWWHVLRSLAQRFRELVVLYSVDVQAKLDLLFSVAERDPLPAGVSCRESLLDRAVVERAHALGLAVVAWTVDSPVRAAELASWGVDGITTHRVKELRALFGSVPRGSA